MLKIWGRPTSTCTERALWTLEESGLPYELILASAMMGSRGHVSKGAAPFGIVDSPEFLAMNPNGTIPVIDDEGFILWESNAIVSYLALKHAPERLYGNNLETFAVASQWMSWANERLEPPLHTLVMDLVRLPEAKRNAKAAEQARQTILKPLATLDRHLSKNAYVAGEHFSLGDIPAGIDVHRWFMFDLERPSMPHLEAWHRRLSQRRGFQMHVAPPEFHLAG